MARKLAPNTIKKFEKRLLAEREQLLTMLEQHQKERENIRISEASAERSAWLQRVRDTHPSAKKWFE